MPDPINSSVVIARLLDSEGFTDYVANQVERYWRRNVAVLASDRRRMSSLDKSISDLCREMPAVDKKTLGNFVGLHKKMSFDVGLRIGLAAFAQRNGKVVVDAPHDPEPTGEFCA